jgi:prevent-host-death family protein
VQAKAVFQRIALIRLTDRVLDGAGVLSPADLPPLVALHLATAVELGRDLDRLVTDNEQMRAAAKQLGFETQDSTRTRRTGTTHSRTARCSTMKHMEEVGIRALKQNASEVVARAANGEVIVVTDRGRAVAKLTPLTGSLLAQMISSGAARPARRSIASLPAPRSGPSLTDAVLADRDDGRF